MDTRTLEPLDAAFDAVRRDLAPRVAELAQKNTDGVLTPEERAKMAEQDARGALAVARQESREEGLAEGLLKGKGDALLFVLSHRGIELTEAERARVAGCGDSALLDLWFQRALAATTVAEVFA